QLSVTSWDEDAGPGEGLCCADEALQVVVGLGDCVTEKSDGSGVARNTSIALNNSRDALTYGVGEFAPSLMAVHPEAKSVAFRNVARDPGAHTASWRSPANRRSLHTGQQLTDLEPQT